MRNIAIVQKNGTDKLFVSMPDYRTDRIKDGKPVYREIVFPVTKDFREKLYGEFEKEYASEKSKSKGDKEPDKEDDRVSKSKKKDKEPEKEVAVVR